MEVAFIMSGILFNPNEPGSPPPPEHHVEELHGRIMEELLDLGAEDCDVGGSLAKGEVIMHLTISDAKSLDDVDAVTKALALFRSALHAAGLDTSKLGNWKFEASETVSA